MARALHLEGIIPARLATSIDTQLGRQIGKAEMTVNIVKCGLRRWPRWLPSPAQVGVGWPLQPASKLTEGARREKIRNVGDDDWR